MKKLYFLLILTISSCSYFKGSNTPEDPLLLPPNFAEIPDINNPEKVVEKNDEKDVEKLKDLLLKSE